MIHNNDEHQKVTNSKITPRMMANKKEESSTLPSNRMFVLCCLVCFTYSLSIAVDSQFLSLYYKSKGLSGTTIGVLFSLAPMTSFLSVFIWSTVISKTGGEKNGVDNDDDNVNNKEKGPHNNIIWNATRISSYQILFFVISMAAIFQTSLVFLEKPTFMMISVILAGIFQSPTKSMLDNMIISSLNDRNDFGKIRLFGILGSGIGTKLGGVVLKMNEIVTDDNNKDIHHQNFDALFLTRLIMTVLPLIFIQLFQKNRSYMNKDNKNRFDDARIKEDEKPSDTSTNEDEGSIRCVVNLCFKNPSHLLFFVAVFIQGTSGGVSDTFSYVRYQEAGCSTAEMGTSRVLSSIAGAIMFWYSGKMSRYFGIEKVFLFSFLLAGTRFHLLATMEHLHHLYIIDLIRSIVFGFFWSSSTLYASSIYSNSPNTRATALLLLNGIYSGAGRSSGSILGGKIQALFGINNLFLYWSYVNFCLAFLLLFFQYQKATLEQLRQLSKKDR